MEILKEPKKLLSILAVCGPVALLIAQQLTGFIPLRPGTADSYYFSILMGIVVSLGFALATTNLHKRVKYFIIAAAITIGCPVIVSGIVSGLDIANGTNIARGLGWYFGLDTMSDQITNWTFLVQTIVGLTPVGIVIAGIIMIFDSDTPSEMMTPIIETAACIGICVVACVLFGWLGVKVF